ncbi:elongation of very long chain fatty acids protein 4-like [Saccostrea echinata]|uniref:elongation of very long chain fatty acids protein 4-like n=1 Tax=Saccostrea echinata TaxID=191078 RepID=UPI002A8188A3|nr:elongation of very long chain fatty acids protein 4-like [Saccostrea echinata]XP_061175717.1 elongation of very long chain fatty acids protein 4-like [Saccostrea echinata]XP_061175718.1 elongation of very long chain fatty acids protein 4-like [Saccostrea echinata]
MAAPRENMTMVETYLTNGDDRMRGWPFMDSPVPILTIFFLYLLMVKQGPKVMEQHKQLQVQTPMVVYNLSVMVLSVYITLEILIAAVQSSYSLTCQPVDYSDDTRAVRMMNACYLYFISKIIELLDTFFFIVRKKESQLTFLHVYHHSIMLLHTWWFVKFVPGGQTFMLALLNSFVHVWMYAYYGLAAMGPHMQKYLWWKKYLTKLQLFQFVLTSSHALYNFCFGDCGFPRLFSLSSVIQSIIFFSLFMNFYIKAYKKKYS